MDSNLVTSVLEVIVNSSSNRDVFQSHHTNVTKSKYIDGAYDKGYIETEMECNLFTFVVYVVIFGTMCLCGLVGNSLSFVVLLWDKYSHLPSTFLLRVLALTDNFFLLATGTSQMFSAVTLYYDIRDHPLMPYIRKYLWPVVYITQTQTVWMTVLISINRFIAICLPFRALSLCTMSRVRFQVGTLTALVVLYNVPRFYEYTIDGNATTAVAAVVSGGGGGDSALKLDRRYNIVYENLLYTLIVFLGPFVVLTALNARLIREIVRLGHRRLEDTSLHHAVRDEDEERNITVVMIVIVVLFLVSQTPACVNQLLFYVIGSETYLCGHPYFYYYHISNVVVSSNACLNFGVYCIFRFRFRQRAYLLFRYGRKSLLKRKTREASVVPRSNAGMMTGVV